MIDRIKTLWKVNSLLGVEETDPYQVKRGQIMSNQLNMAVIVVSILLLLVEASDNFAMGTYDFQQDLIFSFGYRYLLTILIAVINLNLAETKYKYLSRYLLIFFVPFFYIFLPLLIAPIYDELYLWYPYAGIPFLVLPVILLDRKSDSYGFYFFTFLYLSLSIFSSNLLDLFAEEDLLMQQIVAENALFYRVIPLAISVFIFLTIYYLIQVNDRNANRLDQQNQALSDTLLELKKTQHQLIKNEKMAVVGRMSSELTHEINTPISAIKANLSLIAYDQKHRLRLLRQIGLGLSKEEIENLGLLIRTLNQQLAEKSKSASHVDAHALQLHIASITPNKDKVKRWSECFSEIGILDPSPFRVLVESRMVNELIDFIIGEYQQNQSFKISSEAINQAEKLVHKLKSYAYSRDLNEVKPFSLSATVYNSLDLLASQMKQVKTDVTVEPRLPMVFADPDEIMQVINNLLVNGLQAMHYQGDLYLKLYKDVDGILLSIEDTGGGVSIDNQDDVFEAFFTTKEKGEGTGLGLHICKQIIEKHKGQITWTNTSLGAKFIIKLPIYQSDN